MLIRESMARRRGYLKFKGNEKHSGTKTHTIGPGTVVVANHIIRDTEVGDRDPDGGNDTITLGRSYEEECNIGDTCKFINIHIQAGPRSAAGAPNIGWIEWALVCHKGTDTPPTNTNLATSTLGDVCTKYFRNECIYTGAVPVGLYQSNVHEIPLKIPPTKQKLRTGDRYTLYLYARTVSSVETATDTFRVITSFNYKNYH